jgi:adenylylsulfate kinase
MPESPASTEGFVVWIEGLPGSGKSTLARTLTDQLARFGAGSELLDGESVRATFFPELGFTRADRETHARRVSQLARRLARHGVAVVVAMITPYETSRQAARAAFGARFDEVWLSCPIAVCETRAPALYQRGHEGRLPKLTGLDDPFEEPLAPDLVVDTGRLPAEACVEKVLAHLAERKFVPAIPA